MLSIVFCQSVGTSENVKMINIFIQLISITDKRLNYKLAIPMVDSDGDRDGNEEIQRNENMK